MKSIVIIGGGINGLCTAYYLKKEGYEVTVIDRHSIDEGASFINAGYLTPSHFMPLAEPGVISKGLKWMFNSSSPFYIKPRFDLDFFKWAWFFKKSATAEKVSKAIPVIKELNLKSLNLYEEIHNSGAFDFHFERKGLLMVYRTSEAEKHELELAEKADSEGLEVKRLNREDLQKLEPGFKDDILGATHFYCDAHMTPGIFMKNLYKWLEKAGVNFILQEEVEKIISRNNHIHSILTANKEIQADEYVLAAGSWTSSLAKSLGLFIPVQGGKGYSFDITRPVNIHYPAILTEAKVAVTPMENFTRFAGTMEFSGNNNLIRKTRVDALAAAAMNYYKDLKVSEQEKSKAISGLRPVSPDGLPFIGRSGKYKNLSVATGHAMMGWSLGPITGKLVSEIISGKKSQLDLSPLDPARF